LGGFSKHGVFCHLSGVTSARRETGRQRAAEAAGVTQQSTSRQDVTFRCWLSVTDRV